MPSEHRHIARAENNEQFYNQFNLANTGFLDWAVTALFYGSLHYVDACLARYPGGGFHPTSHSKRAQVIALDAFLQNLYSDYEELKNRSEDARYNLVVFPPNFVAMLRGTEFERIRALIRSRLGLL